MLKNILNNLQDKYNQLKEENNHYKELLQNTTTITNLNQIHENNFEPSEHKILYITNECPDLNKEKAKIIAKLIPINETYLTVMYTKEIITNKEYYFIPTNKYLWIVTEKEYLIYPYNNNTCQIIKNNIMSKIILFNNILLEINGTDNKINNFISILIDENFRINVITEKNTYLCGITPTYQEINKIGTGISLDNNNNIVLHTKDYNQLLNLNNITNYELLLDNQVIFGKYQNTNHKITNFQLDCYQITIKIECNNNQNYILPILEPNAFGTKYQRQDTVFQTNLAFAQKIINIIAKLTTKEY